MRFGSVCSGIEAASVAWYPLGWTCAFVSEIEKFPCAVLAHHYPDVPNFGDMTKFKDWPDAVIDVLVGGTPCQSFSVAGLRKGLADPRGNLTLTYLAVAERYRPKWLVWENVPGVLSDGTGAFASFLGGLAELGYGFAYRVLDAQYFGLAQRRRRVFVVGCFGDWRAAAAVQLERESLRGNPAPRREAGERVAGTFKACARSGGWSNSADHAAAGMMVPELAKSVRTPTGGIDREDMHTLIAHALRADGFDASEDGTGRGTPLVPEVACTLNGSGNRTGGNRPPGTQADTAECLVPEVCPALKARDYKGPSSDGDGDGDGAILVPLAFSSKDHGADAGETSPTLRAMGHTGSHPNAGGQVAVALQESEYGTQEYNIAGTQRADRPGHTNNIRCGMQVRRLTPRECERLQGFPDDYTLIPYRGKPAADGPRYKALGNSMAVPVMHWIGKRIAMVEQLTAKAAA